MRRPLTCRADHSLRSQGTSEGWDLGADGLGPPVSLCGRLSCLVATAHRRDARKESASTGRASTAKMWISFPGDRCPATSQRYHISMAADAKPTYAEMEARCASLEAERAGRQARCASLQAELATCFEAILLLRQELADAKQQIAERDKTIAGLNERLSDSPTAKLDEPFSVRAEEQRQAAQGNRRKKRKQKNKPPRKGRWSTADKLKRAEKHENVFPEGVDQSQCSFSHSRPVWRLIDGRTVLVAYHIYRGPRSAYGKIPGAVGRSEFGLEIFIALAYLVYLAGLSLEKACFVLDFFQNLKLSKSQADALLHQLSRHWQREFDRLCTLLANSAVVHADETSWSINSVWAFLSEQARLFFFAVNKDGDTLKRILDAAEFTGILISDDAAVYRNFSRAQKCWAHLLRKAIKLTLVCPDNRDYRLLTDCLLAIYRKACRVQRDKRLADAGRARKVEELNTAVMDACAAVFSADMTNTPGPENDCRLLCLELTRLVMANELFTFVTAEAVETPLGTKLPVAGTNNEAEQGLRNPAGARKTGRTNKSVVGARRQTIITSVLESLRRYLEVYNLTSIIEEICHWSRCGRSCFAERLEKLKLSPPEESILDTLLPVPGG